MLPDAFLILVTNFWLRCSNVVLIIVADAGEEGRKEGSSLEQVWKHSSELNFWLQCTDIILLMVADISEERTSLEQASKHGSELLATRHGYHPDGRR